MLLWFQDIIVESTTYTEKIPRYYWFLESLVKDYSIFI